jgi:putative membrane protein
MAPIRAIRDGIKDARTGRAYRALVDGRRRDQIAAKSDSELVSVELSTRRTGMSFQRTRMSADRTLMSVIRTALALISFGFTTFQVFQKLKEQAIVTHAGAARNFGIALVALGIIMLVLGIINHLQFMYGLRIERTRMKEEGFIHGERSRCRISACISGAARSSPSAIPTATSPCCATPNRVMVCGWRFCCIMPMRHANSPATANSS